MNMIALVYGWASAAQSAVRLSERPEFPTMTTETIRVQRSRLILPLMTPIQSFMRVEASGGILLLLTTIAALIWVNSPWEDSYFDLWSTNVRFGIKDFSLSKPLLLWINDGLMAVLFFVVGMEIKREVIGGELSSLRAATLPIAAAVGGMAVPALLYVAFNAGNDSVNGWGIPMATDIAFALGVLALLGSRAPLSLKIFLTALAIVDDLGAILVIAFFFTDELGFAALGYGAIFVGLLIGANRAGIREPIIFLLLSIGLWIAFLKAGIHPTLAGVIAAMTIPATTLIGPRQFLEKAQAAVQKFAAAVTGDTGQARSDRADAVYELEKASHQIESPLTRLEHRLHPWVAFAIMPIFALANAGLVIDGDFFNSIAEPVSLGIIAGLVIGKPVGIVFASWLVVKLGIASLPRGLGWSAIVGGGLLAGIGFTMSLFISGLAFDAPEQVDQAKAGILIASLIAGTVGWVLLARMGKTPRAAED